MGFNVEGGFYGENSWKDERERNEGLNIRR